MPAATARRSPAAGTGIRKPAARTRRSPAKAATATSPKASPKAAGGKVSSKAGAPAKAPRKAATRASAKAPRKTAASRPTSPASPRTAPKKNPRIPKPKGLEVTYSGHIFRSRLEARWAVLLDLLEIDYDYEVCFYRVGDGLTYLPDFYLPGQDLWLEVKGAAFMDSASMAKCLAAVGGPAPLPSRSAPYAPSGKLMLAGAFHRPSPSRPVHTLITPGPAGTVELSYATFDASGARPIAPAWDKVVADGVKKARRPGPARLTALLEPAPAALPMDDHVREAYRFAAALAFDDTNKVISQFNDPVLLARLARRRAGRPLGLAA